MKIITQKRIVSKNTLNMSEKVQCTICSKFIHANYMQFHLSKCGYTYTCNLCNVNFCSKHSLEKHSPKCKFISVKKEIDEMQQLIETLEKELQSQKDRYEKEINSLVNKNIALEEKVKKNEKRINDYIVIMKKQSSGGKTYNINNNVNLTQINNIMSNIQPVKSEDLGYVIRDIISNPHLPDNAGVLATNIHNRYLKPRVVKMDIGRKIVNWINENEDVVVRDAKAKMLTDKIFEAGKPYLEEKIVQLEQDKRSLTAHPGTIENISKWINVCTSIVNKTEKSKNDFALKITELSYDKSNLQAIESIVNELNDLKTFFINVFDSETSFHLFTGGVRGFAYMLKDNYDDHWAQGEYEIEFRLSRSQNYSIIYFEDFKSALSSVFQSENFGEKQKDKFKIFDGDVTCWKDGSAVKCSRKICNEIIEQTLENLLDPDDNLIYETIYNILLGVE